MEPASVVDVLQMMDFEEFPSYLVQPSHADLPSMDRAGDPWRWSDGSVTDRITGRSQIYADNIHNIHKV